MTRTRNTRLLNPLLLVAALSAASPLSAQDADSTRQAPHDSANVTILDISIDPSANERHVVYLQKGIVYRASFSEQGVTLRMRSLGNKQLPFVVDVSSGADVSGGSELEVYPQADGDIELTVVLAASVPVHFRLWRDARATLRGQRSAEEGYWELGVDGILGWHGDYSGNSTLMASGMTLGGCLSVRNGPGPLGFINGCIVGAEGMGGDDAHRYFGLFTEPHLRFSNGRRTDQGWRSEWGGVIRYAAYAAGNGGNLGDGRFGLGAYLSRDQRDLNGRGWRYTLTLRADKVERVFYDGFGFETGREDAYVPALQLQIGRYR